MAATTKNTDVHVVGGGIGGLAAAAIIARSGRSVTVHEQRGRLGGRATTDERNGYRFNQGPHALYVGGEAMAALKRLGISPRGSAPAIQGALMARDGVTHLAPGGPASLMRTGLIGLRDKLELGRVMARLPKIDAQSHAGRTVRDWVDDLTDRPRIAEIVHALVRLATYVNAPDHLSADVAVGQLQRAFSGGVIYLEGGWHQLVDSLANAVVSAGGVIIQGSATVDMPQAPAVVVAVGGPAPTAALVSRRFECGPKSSASVLDLALDGPPRHRFVIGIDEPRYLADHGAAAGTPQGMASVSLADYLAPNAEPDRDRLRSFARHAGITADHVVDERYLHRLTTVSAIATAAAGGYVGRPTAAVADHPGVFIVGDWVGPHGHLADAVLASAEQAAAATIAHLDRRPVTR